MDASLTLLDRALSTRRQNDLARHLGVSDATFSMAKRRGRLSPTLAGVLADELNEDVEHWIAVAALEAESETPLLERLKARTRNWRKRLLSTITSAMNARAARRGRQHA